MAYDFNVKTENVDLDTKRKATRVTFYRTGDGIVAETIFDEYLVAGNKVISTDKFMVKMEKEQFDGITGFGPFFNGFISQVNDLKEEYDLNGLLTTGSISIL